MQGNLYRYADPSPGKWVVQVNARPLPSRDERGFFFLSRNWKKGDALDLTLPMAVRKVAADPRVEDTRGKIALERGPLVFCLEGQDNTNGEVLSLVVSPAAPLNTSFERDLLGGVQVIRGTATGIRRTIEGGIESTPIREFTAIPYYAWAHRGRSQMTVWPAMIAERAKPAPAPTLAFASKISTSGGRGIEALNDQFLPGHSNDRSIPYFHWWPKKGTTEWIEYRFAAPAVVSSASVYWFDDTGTGECRVPTSWTLLYRSGPEWKPVGQPTSFGTTKDKKNYVTFRPVETDGFRLEVRLPEGFSAGLYEWEVK
jgi:hypothetical protein